MAAAAIFCTAPVLRVQAAEPASRNLRPPQSFPTSPVRLADAAPSASLTAMVPLNEVENVPERVVTARVTDADGRVIGVVQKVEIENGRPARIAIALLGSANTVALEAGSVRYDAANNVVATSESASQLLARPRG